MTSTGNRRAAQQTPKATPQLQVPAEQLRSEIDERLAKGQDLVDRPIGDEASLERCRHDYYTWNEYNEALLRRSFDQAKPADRYIASGPLFAFGGPPDPLPVRWQELQDDIVNKLRRLRSIRDQLSLFNLHPDAASAVPKPRAVSTGNDIFIVHGHDGATKTAVARFLAMLTGREPVILHERPDRGRTIIEKFEDHAAAVGCVVVLLTADDEGGAVGKSQQPRARQNVVLELGYFLGKLGRDKVLILREPHVELPSDINGVIYTSLDDSGAWRNLVARELKEAGVVVDLEVLLRA